MKRHLTKLINKDLDKKIILLTGPRQCGKTTISKSLSNSYDYINFDSSEDRKILREQSWDRSKSLVIFDELHKHANWKSFLKGVYDKEGLKPNIIVTGSARMDTYRKVGDSLAGRYFQFRLHPLDPKEAYHYWKQDPHEIMQRLICCGGFPEPFLSGSPSYYQRWQKTHSDIILRQDLLDLTTIQDIKAIETLMSLLKTRIGSTISYANLARDLEKDIKTIKRYLQILEDMYLIFKISPYHKNIARSLLKEPKYYFYDVGLIPETNIGAKYENIVAASILKELHFLEDSTGCKTSLHFLRTKDGIECDFLVEVDDKKYIIEVKTNDDNPTKAFNYFAKYVADAENIQLVANLKREKSFPNGLVIKNLLNWLINIDLNP